jgi:branched-chain amino acid transport system substrate-binding protein
MDTRERAEGLSRRQFLKIAGVAGATLGLGTTLGGAMAACGSSDETTTTAAGSATTGASTATTAGTSATTAASTATTGNGAATAGKTIKIGVVSPQTGGLAMYGIVDKWWIDHAQKALGDGIVGVDGKKHPIEIVIRDSQSDSNRAAQIAGDMIQNDKCDMILAGGTPDTIDPAADQAEAMETPMLANLSPYQPFYAGRNAPADGFKWTYGLLLGTGQAMHIFVDVYGQLQTNKVVGMLFANDADAQGWLDKTTGAPVVLEKYGYKMVLPTLYQPGAEDFTAQISEFKSKGCEIICGTNNPSEFTNFWNQCLQQNYHPKIVSTGKALGYVSTLNSIGDIAFGLLGEGVWHPTWPFKDTLTGMTCQELADDYEKFTGDQWTAAIAGYAKFEWAIDVYKRAIDPEDKEKVVDAILQTNMTTSMGPVNMTEKIDPNGMRPNKNCYKQLFCAVQWRKGTKYKFEPVIVGNAEAKMVAIQSKIEPMVYK